MSSLIAARKQNATPEEQSRFSTVPVQQGQNNAVNGGLVGTGKSESAIVPQAPLATSSAASSTDSQATSTESVLDAGELVAEDEAANTASSSDLSIPSQ